MIKPISRDTSSWYVLQRERDLPESEQTAFEVTPFQHFDYKAIVGILGQDFDASSATGGRMFDVIYDGARSRIRGFRNFLDENGEEMPCTRESDKTAWGPKREMLTRECAEPISFNDLAEVFTFCMGDCRLSEDDRKNS